ncbi:hypothetical protein [Streptomyces niveus]|uniref:hypothetical protein n=1 Tax=Streptomyces niveus TaxID=193462 RepID=UPI00343A0AE5
MRSKFGLLLILGLLAVAFPAATVLLYQTLCMAVGAVLIAVALVTEYLSLVCSLVAVGLLAYFFPDSVRRSALWLAQALADAVRSVMPQEKPESVAPTFRR